MSEARARQAGALAYVRSGLFAAWVFGSALVIGTAFLPALLGPRRYGFLPAKAWAHGMFAALRVLFGVRIEIRGREHLPPGPSLLACKHQGMLDTMVALSIAPDPCIVLKRELMWIPIFGWYAWKVRMIPIDRGGGSQTIRQMVAVGREALAAGRQVLIYPEGTRRDPGAEPVYKGGIGILYRELGVACVPVATNSGRVWPAHGLLKYPGVAVFDILPPIAPGLTRAAFMARLETDLEQASSALL